MNTNQKKCALLSVTDKSKLTEFAHKLIANGYQLLSTGGTAEALRKADIQVTDVSEYTGSEEILGGRVKTLHPKIHGGILFDRNNPEQASQAKALGLWEIDLVVVNLYQFGKQAVKQKLSLEDAINHIDIGGPTMLRAAAKNWESCTPVIDPEDYNSIADEISNGGLSKPTRIKLAAKTFANISAYDHAISEYFAQSQTTEADELAGEISLTLNKTESLRYGENPHQQAALYQVNGSAKEPGFASLNQLNGKAISYNNLIDLDSACNIAADLSRSAAITIIKHTNPCGTAASLTADEPLVSIFERALSGDPKSAFGGILACSREIDEATATAMSKIFFECIAAPSYSKQALEILRQKKNLRVIETPWIAQPIQASTKYRSILGAVLAQTDDTSAIRTEQWKVATTAVPDEQNYNDLEFAMTIAKHVKSNAIVYVKDLKTITIGAGQMSRIDSAAFAAEKAKEEGKSLQGAVMASDAFFPFRDTVDQAAKFGIKFIVQPGGSIRDQESIDAANEHGVAMVLTGERHFRH